MNRLLQRLLITLGITAALALVPATAGAQFDPIDRACDSAPNSTACQSRGDPDENPVVETIKRVSRIIATIAGIVAVLMIIFFGFQFVTSAGDPQKAKSARMGIIFSAVGLAVIALSVPIINIILSLIG